MSIQILDKITDFKEYLENIKNNNQSSQELFTHNIKKLILSIIETYQHMHKLANRQRKILRILQDLQIALEHIIISTIESDYNL